MNNYNTNLRGKTFQHDSLSFARIFVDYNNIKNPISMSFPREEGSFKLLYYMLNNIYFSFFKYLSIVNGILIIFLIFLTNFTSFYLNNFLLFWIIEAFILSSIVWFPPILTLIIYFNKKLYKKMPNFYANWTMWEEDEIKYVKKKRLDSTTLMIPIFNNLFIDVKMSGDFKKYKKSINIKEHDFDYVILNNKKEIKKKYRNDDVWFCVLTFSKIPRKGELEIWFY